MLQQHVGGQCPEVRADLRCVQEGRAFLSSPVCQKLETHKMAEPLFDENPQEKKHLSL